MQTAFAACVGSPSVSAAGQNGGAELGQGMVLTAEALLSSQRPITVMEAQLSGARAQKTHTGRALLHLPGVLRLSWLS